MEGFGSHPRTASTLCFGHDHTFWAAAEWGDSNILPVMLFVRAVGGFPAYGKSECSAFSACCCCAWSSECFLFQYLLLLMVRKVFHRIIESPDLKIVLRSLRGKKAFLDIVFHFGRRKYPQAWLVWLISFHYVATIWKNHLSIKKENWFNRKKKEKPTNKTPNSLKIDLFLLYVNSENDKIRQKLFFIYSVLNIM